MASVGEPLNPEAVVWGERGLRPAVPRQLVADRDRRDHDRQLPRRWTIKPGSMGRPLPGIDAPASSSADRRRRRCGEIAEPDGRGRARAAARLAVDVPRLPERGGALSQAASRGGWYLTGDLARRDADGYFWFVGRADDVIKTRRPPHRPVRGRERADGAPGRRRGRRDRHADPVAGEVVKAFVALQDRARAERGAARASCSASPATRLGAGRRAQEIAFAPDLPKTRSGKIMRRLLKARELGLPEGDISTLESEER